MLWLRPVALYFLINDTESISEKIKQYEIQLFRLEAFISANNLQVYTEYYDIVYNGTSFSMNGFKQLTHDWNNGAFDFLLTARSFSQMRTTADSMGPPIFSLDNHFSLSNFLA